MNVVVSYVQNSSVEDSFLQVKVVVYGDNDVRTPDQAAPFGVDSRPIDGVYALYSDTAASDQQVILAYLNPDPKAEKGEVRIYSADADYMAQAYAWWKADGTLELNGADDNAVRYSELAKAFNKLRDDFNALVQAYNAHTHITTATVGATPTPGVINPTTSTGQSSSADISPAKVDTVKLPK